jgi:ribosomal protein L11 methyltransferase
MAFSAPLKDLFIYQLEGRYPSKYDGFRDNFIGNWQEADSAFLFFSSPAEADLERLLQSQQQLRYVDSYRMPYQDWIGGEFDGLEHGKIRIIPAWKTPAIASGDSENRLPTLLLDPGVVFGTGTHPTTRQCLEALELTSDRDPLESVLDLGTGSGLLALAAARMGARRVLAVDVNLLAARTTLENVRRNRLLDRIVTVQGRAEDFIHLPADLLMANIHYEIMRQLVESDRLLVHQRFILSGLMRREAKDIANRLARRSIRILQTWNHDGVWFTFLGCTAPGSG